MKLARSTTFSPEKILSFAIGVSPGSCFCWSCSAALEPWRALFEESGRTFLLVLGCSTEAKIRSLEQQAFALACLGALVCRFERELDRDRGVGGDFLQNGFGARHELRRRNDLVDEPD